MKKLTTLICFLCISFNMIAQKDSLRIGDSYLEDQLYVGIRYLQLYNQPENVIGSGFSYGFNSGYIKDISLITSGRWALGIGVGYAFDSFNHGYKVSEQNNNIVIEVASSVTETSSFNLQSIEFPFEIRWRTSSANKYKFWRVYSGFKLSYNVKSILQYSAGNTQSSYHNIARLNRWQYGLTIAAGYSTFNFSLYYGLSPLFKDTTIGTNTINTKVIKLGMMFYLL